MNETAIRPGAISLEQLIALNDEIAALARSGMPLESGLLGVGGDLPGRLGVITRNLGRHMEGGQSLRQALEAEGAALPSTYRAVVEAGLRSGRLPQALEGLAGFARGYVELRRAMGLAIFYPVIVLVVGYGLLVAFFLEMLPRLREAFDAFRVPMGSTIAALEGFAGWLPYWGPILPLALFVVGCLWVRSGRASAFQPGRIGRGLRWIPGLKGIFEWATAGQFAEWLALLTEHGVPWAEAIELAADATGDGRLKVAARHAADASRRGEALPPSLRGSCGFPPLLSWLLATAQTPETLAPALRHAADMYRRRAMRKASRVRSALPSLLLLIIGGSAAFLYVMALFVPWTRLLSGLSRMP